jgi:hypothetical protein
MGSIDCGVNCETPAEAHTLIEHAFRSLTLRDSSNIQCDETNFLRGWLYYILLSAFISFNNSRRSLKGHAATSSIFGAKKVAPSPRLNATRVAAVDIRLAFCHLATAR